MTAPERTCPRCAAPLAGAARFCPACGLGLSRLSPGEVLDGKYEILDKIGEGGMGEVYRARHLHLDEIRIIKVTKPDASGGAAQPRRFQEEARIATLVRHPNVAALYDFSRQPDGSFYMVWEFIAGETLEAWLKHHGPLPPDRALDVARQVLAGLAEIHAQGIVHRDLSPDNIMLRETADGRLQAKIIDLGIAKRVASESLQMTGTGLFLGKLKYCSPEQAGALPSGQSVDGRTDLYSFGVVLYEMLTGKAPFESATPEGYIGKHLHTAPPPLDVRPAAEGARRGPGRGRREIPREEPRPALPGCRGVRGGPGAPAHRAADRHRRSGLGRARGPGQSSGAVGGCPDSRGSRRGRRLRALETRSAPDPHVRAPQRRRPGVGSADPDGVRTPRRADGSAAGAAPCAGGCRTPRHDPERGPRGDRPASGAGAPAPRRCGRRAPTSPARAGRSRLRRWPTGSSTPIRTTR